MVRRARARNLNEDDDDDDMSRRYGLLRFGFTPAGWLVLVVIAFIAIVYLLLYVLFPSHPKLVIIMPINQGGGVLNWKGPQEWAVEKVSIGNKRAYARKHGYELAVMDMSMQRKYAHEWRESWEKVDTIKRVMRDHPHAEWFWWLDLTTFIMEPSISLERHLFDNLQENVVRNLSVAYNPLDMRDVEAPYVDFSQPINMIVPQDCGGFNLGSFFLRRSEWTERLLDVWWDPVFYEQKHMQWAQKEQDAFQELYRSQSWLRSSVAFVGNRKINAFPPGACTEAQNDRQFFYAERDFVINLAGCVYRNCYDELMYYKELSSSVRG
ncbi:alpha-1,6-mannosyltransferase [Savitreella phatthalungensis]